MNRKTLIAANWKMNLGVEESLKYFSHLTRGPLSFINVDIVICPPFTSLYTASVALQETSVVLGAQNCHFEDSGAYTGEISPAFLKELACQYVIVGHSERRQIFKETNADIAKKLRRVLDSEMTPIFCVGETEAERKGSETYKVVEEQLREGLAKVDRSEIEKIVIAYEPVWAIGTGNTATPAQAGEVHTFIRNYLAKHYGMSFAVAVRIIYGGSVKPDNIRTLLREPDIDGGLIGGASLNPEHFMDIVRESATIVK